MRLAKIRPTLPRRPGSVWGDEWNCKVCGLKPYRHDDNDRHGYRPKGCAGYVGVRAREILGWLPW